MTNAYSPSLPERQFSVDDFFAFGERYGIDYRFPELVSSRDRRKAQRVVVQGHVEEMILSSGISLTSSDVRVMQPYESTSLQGSPLYTLVVLGGCINLRVNQREFVVRAGMAFSTRLGEQEVMHVRHAVDHPLRTLALGIHPGQLQLPPLLAALLHQWECRDNAAFLWPVPDYLLAGLQQALSPSRENLARQLMLEGTMLQLLGHGLALDPAGQQGRMIAPPCERRRLDALRDQLQLHPEKPYTLTALAQQAAMSPTSLRNKFRQAYGISVFDFLRNSRLALAYRLLEQGHPVQQAAWMSGYQHATNLATAFRRHYGIAPSDVPFSPRRT
ncbi:helix-turn-helix transcriptional regulator [Candidatus Symbiopectobacterium sp. NZEC127]|uniref:helix-turn-helix transcriptional regulator n=1 Tax=Candidatus Symbiopectobacterium sp. NZEC127 TaxID=2820472 RepID=UPI002227700F|nr:AraC family transcriptional regulator [Candidatus Symbiopectobacterium sp. NZEC127]